MKNQKFAVRYINIIDNLGECSETMEPRELKYWLQDDRNGEIHILEIDQTFDGWETMDVLYRES